MNVLLCAACGTRLTAPVRRLDAMPERPEGDGMPDADGRRHGPSLVPRGTYVVDPLPFGAPFVPTDADEEEYDGVVPGGMWMSDERGFLVSDGPRGTYVPHPLDVVDLDLHADTSRLGGCCGLNPFHGVNRVCPCGAEVAVHGSDCWGGNQTRLVPGAVRVEAAA